MFVLGTVSAPIAFSNETQNKGLSYTERNCDNGSCTVTTCFENKPCIVTNSNDLPTKTTSSNDKIPQVFGDSYSDSDLGTMEFMDMFDSLFDFN